MERARRNDARAIKQKAATTVRDIERTFRTSAMDHSQKSAEAIAKSALPRIVLQKSQNAVGSISRKMTKRAAIVHRCSFRPATEVARELVTN
jgi:hypothetical protein